MAKILIVDDHPMNRELLTTLLSYRQHSTVEAANGQEALEAVRRERPDLIISDILMPVMDGYEFVRQLREDPEVGHTPVIFSTAHYLSREASALAASCGVTRFLYKPAEPEDVLRVTTEVLGEQGGAPPTPPAEPASAPEFDREYGRLVSEQLAQKNRALEHANQRLSEIVALGLRLARERDPRRLMVHSCRSARALIGAGHALVALVDEDGAVREHAVEGLDAGAALTFPGRPSGLFAALVARRAPVLHPDPGSPAAPADLGLPAGYPPVRSLLAVPMETPNRLHGWLCLTDKAGAAAFDAEDEDLARIIGSQIAAVLENIRLYGELDGRATQLEREVAEHRRTADALTLSERKARQAESRYRAVVETAVDAMVVIDEVRIIQSFNRAAETIFGYTAAEAVGANVSMLMAAPHRSAHDSYVKRYLGNGERRIIGIGREVEGRRKDGSTFPLDLAIAEWRDGDRRYFTGIMRDITERKRSEDAMRAAKVEAERANIAKSKFLAAASHDLRQPVQSLLLFIDVLRGQLGGRQASSTIVDAIEKALDALRMLLDSLLDVSRLDAGIVVPQPVEVPLADVLERLRAEYGPRAEAAGIRFRVVPTAAVVRSDPALLGRMLRNLVENALRYTPRGGVLIGCRRQGEQLRIEVVDTGIGIARERQEDVFEEFCQIGNPERDRSKGLGLGLAVVRRLGRLLGHEVTLRSEPGRGSAFAVRVAAVRAAVPAETPPARASAEGREGGRKGFIIVVDDDVLIRMGMAAMLEGWGYEVRSAGSVDEAVSCLVASGTRPDAILADYRLRNGQTGIDAIHAIHAHFDRGIPAAIITGDTAVERLAEARQGGFQLLHKPIASGDLRASVAGMLR